MYTAQFNMQKIAQNKIIAAGINSTLYRLNSPDKVSINNAKKYIDITRVNTQNARALNKKYFFGVDKLDSFIFILIYIIT